MSDDIALAGQLRETTALLPVDLRSIATGSGDIPAGGARDTSLEFRATFGSAVVCDTLHGALVLSPAATSTPGAPVFSGLLAAPQPGDTVWILSVGDSTPRWISRRLTSVGSTPGGACASGGPLLTALARAITRVTLQLDSGMSTGVVGAPVRFTHLLRYSLYKASDGAWYLGQRDWNASTLKFNTIQPVSGPFLSAASRGVAFHYFDTAGVEVPSGSAQTTSVAIVRMIARGETRRINRIGGYAVNASGRHTDSVALTVLLRNRR